MPRADANTEEPIRRFRVSIYGVLLVRGRVLVTETRGAAGDTFVNFPGGGIERGEDPEGALVREFREETGLIVRPTRIVYGSLGFHRSHFKPSRQLIGFYWLVERRGGRFKSGNGDDVVRAFWAKADALHALPFTTFDREALPHIAGALEGSPRRF